MTPISSNKLANWKTALENVRNKLSTAIDCHNLPSQLAMDLIKASSVFGEEYERELARQINAYLNTQANGASNSPNAPMAIFHTMMKPYSIAGFIDPMKAEKKGSNQIDTKATNNSTFEYVVFDQYNMEDVKKLNLNSRAQICTNTHVSEGLNSPETVALFPENFWGGLYSPNGNEPILYLIDRFASRTKSITYPIVEKSTTPGSFVKLKSAMHEKHVSTLIEKLSASWTWFHEHFHQTGPMQLPEFGKLKEKNFTAGLEEVRVDMLAVNELTGSSNPHQQLLAEFILAERMLRYPVHNILNKRQLDYDAVGSQLLLGYLLSRQFATIKYGMIDLASNWSDGINKFCKKIESVEKQACKMLPTVCTQEEDLAPARSVLKQFVQSFVDYDSGKQAYTSMPFYEEAAERHSSDLDCC